MLERLLDSLFHTPMSFHYSTTLGLVFSQVLQNTFSSGWSFFGLMVKQFISQMLACPFYTFLCQFCFILYKKELNLEIYIIHRLHWTTTYMIFAIVVVGFIGMELSCYGCSGANAKQVLGLIIINVNTGPNWSISPSNRDKSYDDQPTS